MTDIFHWANQIDSMKRDLQVEIFLFNKNYTPYTIRKASDIEQQLAPVFMFDLINQITMNAAMGSIVEQLEKFDPKRHLIATTPLENVGRAETLIHLIEHERHDIVEFSQEEHEFKRMLGMVAVYTHPTNKDVKFYVVKLLQASASISSGVAWQIVDGQLEGMQPDVALKVPVDNQVLITNGDIFIFNEAKFIKLFNYDIQLILATDERGKAMTEHFKLSMPQLFDDFAVFVRESKANIKKLMSVDMALLPSQETVMDIADSMAIELMTDDAGAIILFDSKDVGVFLDIVNDNYLTSETGNSYLAKSKKLIAPSE